MYNNGWKGESKFKRKFYDVDENTNCWLWKGKKCKNGYGRTRHGGGSQAAHRYMYTLYKGEFDPSLDVLHSCDIRNCVNPDHLFLGTHSDNMFDMYKKGRRTQKGSSNGNYKHGKYVREDL